MGKLARIKWLIIGGIFLLLGIVGLFLPILQGVLFIVIGIIFLAKGSATVRAQKMNFKKRFPRIGSKLSYLEEKARDWRNKRRQKKESKE